MLLPREAGHIQEPSRTGPGRSVAARAVVCQAPVEWTAAQPGQAVGRAKGRAASKRGQGLRGQECRRPPLSGRSERPGHAPVTTASDASCPKSRAKAQPKEALSHACQRSDTGMPQEATGLQLGNRRAAHRAQDVEARGAGAGGRPRAAVLAGQQEATGAGGGRPRMWLRRTLLWQWQSRHRFRRLLQRRRPRATARRPTRPELRQQRQAKQQGRRRKWRTQLLLPP